MDELDGLNISQEQFLGFGASSLLSSLRILLKKSIISIRRRKVAAHEMSCEDDLSVCNTENGTIYLVSFSVIESNQFISRRISMTALMPDPPDRFRCVECKKNSVPMKNSLCQKCGSSFDLWLLRRAFPLLLFTLAACASPEKKEIIKKVDECLKDHPAYECRKLVPPPPE